VTIRSAFLVLAVVAIASSAVPVAGQRDDSPVIVVFHDVLDKVDRTHPDLNVVNHVNFTSTANAPACAHGTRVAGVAAARDDTFGVVGAAPGAAITAVKVTTCDPVFFFASSVIKGVDWVTANAVRPAVVNMSLGGGTVTSSGTSYAAPHVAGTAGLYLSTHPSATPAEVEAALESSALAPGTLSKNLTPVRIVYAGGY